MSTVTIEVFRSKLADLQAQAAEQLREAEAADDRKREQATSDAAQAWSIRDDEAATFLPDWAQPFLQRHESEGAVMPNEWGNYFRIKLPFPETDVVILMKLSRTMHDHGFDLRDNYPFDVNGAQGSFDYESKLYEVNWHGNGETFKTLDQAVLFAAGEAREFARLQAEAEEKNRERAAAQAEKAKYDPRTIETSEPTPEPPRPPACTSAERAFLDAFDALWDEKYGGYYR